MKQPLPGSNPSLAIGQTVRVVYSYESITKIRQTSYTTIKGVHSAADRLVIFPDTLQINRNVIRSCKRVDDYWVTDSESHNMPVKICQANAFRVDLKDRLKSLGLPSEIRHWLGHEFNFLDLQSNLICGYIASIHFVKERNRRVIRFTPEHSFLYDKKLGWQSLDFFEFDESDSSWAAHNNKSVLLSGIRGQLTLL